MDSAMLTLPRTFKLRCTKPSFVRVVLQSLSVLFALMCSQTSALAQDTVQKQTLVAKEVEQVPLDLTVASDGNVSQTGDILRLEETIRGNKEQPKVLSIVPWQLPLHQRIDRNEQRWAPIKTQLKSMERSSFLKEIKLIDVIQPGQPIAQAEAKNQ